MAIVRFTNPNTQRVFEAEDCNFRDFKKLMFDTGLKKEEIGTEKANEKIREVFNRVLGIDGEADARDRRKAMRRHQIDVYEIIEEVVPDLLRTGWGENPFWQENVEYRNLALGDANEFVIEDDTILTVSKVSGNHHDIIRQRLGEGETFQVRTSWYAVKIYTEFERFMAGQVDWAGFIQKIYQAFDKKMNVIIYDSFKEALGKITPNSLFIGTGQATEANKTDLLEIVQNVQAATGEEVTIAGTKVGLSALDKMANVNWISDNMKDTRNTLGRLAIWEGVRLIEIPQAFADKTLSSKLVDDNKLLIMPSGDNRFIKVVDEGDAIVTQVTDQATHMDMTMDYEYQQKLGVATVLNKKFGTWTITA